MTDDLEVKIPPVEVLTPPAPTKPKTHFTPVIWGMFAFALLCAVMLPTIAWLQSRGDASDSAVLVKTLIEDNRDLNRQVSALLADNDRLTSSLDCVTREDASLDIEKSKTLAEMGRTLRPLADSQNTLMQALVAAFGTNDNAELARLLEIVPDVVTRANEQLDALDGQTAALVLASEEREATVAKC